MKTLHQIATEYAEKNFPITEISTGNIIKHDVSFHSFCDGFNEAVRILMQIAGMIDLDKRIDSFNFMHIEEDKPWHNIEIEGNPKSDGLYKVRAKTGWAGVLNFESDHWCTIGYQSDIKEWAEL